MWERPIRLPFGLPSAGGLAQPLEGVLLVEPSATAWGAEEVRCYGGAAGGLLASATELISGSLTKDVTYTIMTDFQLTEKTTKGKKIHQARVASTAEQVNSRMGRGRGEVGGRLGQILGWFIVESSSSTSINDPGGQFRLPG